MSTLKVNNLQVGQDSTATNNLTWFQPGSPDGTIRLGSGNAGSATTKFTFDKDGNLTCVGNINAASILAPIEGTLDDWIIHAGDTNTKFGFPAADVISFETGGDERLRINSDGRIWINTQTGSSATELLRVENTGTSSTDSRVSIISGGAAQAVLLFGDDQSFNQGQIVYSNVDHSMRFHANAGNERLRINSAGTVRIKRPVSTTLDNDSIFLGIGDTENATNCNRMIGFGYVSTFGTSVYPASMGYTESDNSGNTKGALTFNTRNTTGATDAPVERLRIDSSGRLLKSGQASLTSTSLNYPVQIAADSEAQNIVCFGRASDDIGEIAFFEADKSTRLGEIQYRQDHTNIRHRVGDIRFCTGGAAEKVRITGGGSVNIGGDYTQTSKKFKVTGNTTLDGGLHVTGLLEGGSGFSIINGNLTLPAYTYHDADSDTYYGFSGADEFSIFTGGAQRLRVQSDGNMRWFPDGSTGVNLYATSVTSGIVLAANKDGSVGTSWHFKNQNSSGSAQTWMEVDDSQRVHIPYGMGGTDKLNVYVAADVTKGINIIGQDGNNQNSDSGRIHFNGYAQTNGPWIGGDNETAWGKKGLVFGTVSTTNDYTTELAETMRLTRSGDIQWGISPNNSLWDSSNNEQGFYYRRSEGTMTMATRSSTGYSNWYINKNTQGGTADTRWIDFYWDQNTKDKIWYNSGNVAFGGYSDYRLKENITEIDDGIAKVKQLKPSYYNWKTGTGRDEFSDVKQSGFIAHELQSVLPNLVDGTKDQVVTQEQVDAGTQPEENSVGTPIYQSIDYQRITPMLTAALKEAISKIEVLEAKVAALESS